jgi:hypothetical protein
MTQIARRRGRGCRSAIQVVPVSAHGSASEPELRLGVHDLLDDGEQIEGTAR